MAIGHSEGQPTPDESGDTQQIVSRLNDLCEQVAGLRAEVTGRTKEMYTTEEVARMTGRSPYTIRAWVHNGRLLATRVSGSGPRGRLLIPRAELRKLIPTGRGEGLSGILG